MTTYRRAVCALFAAALIAPAQPSGKELLPGEFNSYNDIVKDINLRNFPKALVDIETWRQRFPTSAYRDDAAAMEIQALAETNQPGKALDSAGVLMSRGLESVYPGEAGQPTVIRLLYSATWAISQMRDPSAEQIAVGRNAAQQLLAYDKQLPGVSAAQWEQARADMRDKAAAALFYLSMLPGVRAMAKQPPDCAAAESAYALTLGGYPDRSVLSYEMGRALNCQVKDHPDKVFAAVYEFERAAVTDPTLGDPKADPAKVRTFADSAYMRVHGSTEGLDALKELARQSPLPPVGFRFATAAEIAEQKRAEFEQSNPQLAMWMKIKAALQDAGGAAYFDTQMKDSSVPPLRGVLVEAKPACRPKELWVAVPLPDGPKAPTGEIRLKLDKPLTGKPAAGAELQWEGVATSFTPDPFLLTMDAEATKITGVRLDPCATPIRKKRT